jgi:hypothetical protein
MKDSIVMKSLLVPLVLLSTGCVNQAQPTGREVDIIVVAPMESQVRVTYQEHNLLNTVYLSGEACRFDIGPTTIKGEGASVELKPNGQCR